MRRTYGLLLAVIFLAVQFFSTMHMAEHGFQPHKHHGHICDIYLYCEHAKIAGAPAPDFAVDYSFVTLALSPISTTIFSQDRNNSAAPRAPPAFS